MKSVFSHVKKSKGNIFSMLFAAVGMTGVLGVVGVQTVSGPIRTITRVTQENIVDTDLMTNSRIVILNAGIQAAGGDIDGDNYVEPAAFNTTCTANPSGGGCLPTDIGAIQTDPWGTSYGYCVWDHGTPTNSSTNRLDGAASTSEPVIAVISAGRDKTFQTSCEPFDGSGPEGLVEVTGSDDSVRIYSYDAAVAGASGLWQLRENDPTTAEIVKDLQIGTFDDAAGTGFEFDIGSGEGKFPSVTTDILTAWTGDNIEIGGGLRLDDQTGVTSCGAGDAGVIRYNSTDDVIEVCDGAGDWDGADETAIIDENGDTQVQVEEGANDDTIRFDTAGAERMVIEADGDVVVGTDSFFVDESTGSIGLGELSPEKQLHLTGDGFILLENPLGHQAGININNSSGTLHLLSNYDATSQGISIQRNGDVAVNDSDLFVDATNNRVGVGTSSPASSVHISNNSPVITFTDTDTNADSRISASSASGGLGIQADFNNEVANSFVVFSVDGDEKMRVRSDGNVGIGDNIPDTLLDVDGAIEIGAGTCDGSGAGRVQYTALNNIQYCDGGSWQTITGYVAELDDIGDVNVTGVASGQTLMWNGTEWVATSTLSDISTGDTDLLVDNDNDTKVQVEKTADDDYIRFDTAGSERMQIAPNGRIGINQDFDTADTEATVAISSSVGTSTNVAIRTSTDVTRGADLYMGGSGLLVADGSIDLYIDGDDNNTNASFNIRKNSKVSGGVSSEDLMSIHENGDVSFFSGYLRMDEDGDGDFGFLTEAGLDGIGLASNAATLATPELYVTRDGNVGINTTTAVADFEVAGTDAILFPRGIAGNRPTVPVNGMMRYNTAVGKFEAYQAGAWQDILTSGSGNVARALADADNDTKVQVEEGPDDDTIRFDTAGHERMVVGADGNIGIGTSVPDTMLTMNAGVITSTQKDILKLERSEGSAQYMIFSEGNGGHVFRAGNSTTNAKRLIIDATTNTSNDPTTGNEVGIDLRTLGTTRVFIAEDGNVGIGSSDTDGTFTITGAPDIVSANNAGTGGLVIQNESGDTSGAKMRMDVNEIQASNNNAASFLALNPHGGNVILGFGVAGSSNLDMSTGRIIDLADPIAAQDGATKAYVDDLVTGGTGDSGAIDGLDSTQFIRSDVNDDVSAHTEWQDNMHVRLGTDGDFRMYFSGTGTVMRSYAHGAHWILQGEDAGGTNRNMIIADPDNATTLYYAGVSKLSTNPGGVSVTGKILNLTDPTGPQDAATKAYVDSTVASAGGTDLLFDADNDTKIQVEEGTDDDTIRFDTAGTERMIISPTGHVEATRHIVSGVGSGGVGMTHNDGYGNANLTFNHVAGTPEQNGNAGRISVNTDDASGAYMAFELKDSVTNGVATALNDVMYLSSDGRIGLSANDTDGTVTITGAPDITAVNAQGQGGLVIQDVEGDSANWKMRVDANEIQVSNNGAPGNLVLNAFGGNIGIGTTTPGAALDVDGTFFARDVSAFGRGTVDANTTMTIDGIGGDGIRMYGTLTSGADISMNSAGFVSSGDSFYISIDSENNSNSNAFVIVKDVETSPDAVEPLFQVSESGLVKFTSITGAAAPTK